LLTGHAPIILESFIENNLTIINWTFIPYEFVSNEFIIKYYKNVDWSKINMYRFTNSFIIDNISKINWNKVLWNTVNWNENPYLIKLFPQKVLWNSVDVEKHYDIIPWKKINWENIDFNRNKSFLKFPEKLKLGWEKLIITNINIILEYHDKINWEIIDWNNTYYISLPQLIKLEKLIVDKYHKYINFKYNFKCNHVRYMFLQNYPEKFDIKDTLIKWDKITKYKFINYYIKNTKDYTILNRININYIDDLDLLIQNYYKHINWFSITKKEFFIKYIDLFISISKKCKSNRCRYYHRLNEIQEIIIEKIDILDLTLLNWNFFPKLIIKYHTKIKNFNILNKDTLNKNLFLLKYYPNKINWNLVNYENINIKDHLYLYDFNSSVNWSKININKLPSEIIDLNFNKINWKKINWKSISILSTKMLYFWDKILYTNLNICVCVNKKECNHKKNIYKKRYLTKFIQYFSWNKNFGLLPNDIVELISKYLF